METVDFLRHRDWVVSTLAGEPFVEKPPLFYIVSAGSAYLFGGCLHLGEPQRGLLVYFAQVTTERLETVPDARCKTLLVQGWRATGAPAPASDWIAVWEGARPGDLKEFYRLYRKDVALDHAVVKFPQIVAASLGLAPG